MKKFKNKALLTNRTWDTSNFENLGDSWYTPREILQSFKSVKDVVLYDTCSSAGDWSGFFVQELNKTKHVITFGQTNNYPHGGYTLFTNGVAISFQGEWDIDDLTTYFCDNFC